jgi:hypothetical protein
MSKPLLSHHTAAEIVDGLFDLPAEQLQEISFLMAMRNQEILRRAQQAFAEQMAKEAVQEQHKAHIRSKVDKIIKEVDDGKIPE